MKFSILLIPAACISAAYSHGFLDRRADKCGAGNNCQRGVGGTAGVKPPLTSRLADCSSLNTVTVSPSTTTTTSTVTITYGGIPTVVTPRSFPPSQPKKRDIPGAATITPTVVPTYATYCSSASAYYSACSCAGVTPVTTTLPTPTETVYETTSVCVAMNAVRRGLEALGYEVDEHFDAVYYPGIRLF